MVSGTTMSSAPSSIFTSASSIFATFLTGGHTHTHKIMQKQFTSNLHPFPFLTRSHPNPSLDRNTQRTWCVCLPPHFALNLEFLFLEQNQQHCSKNRFKKKKQAASFLVASLLSSTLIDVKKKKKTWEKKYRRCAISMHEQQEY